MARKTKADAMRTRNNIIESALNIFCEKNYSNVTITEIAARVGMTKGAFYWHFKSKNDILIHLIKEMCRQTERDFIDIYGVPKSIHELRAYYKSALTRPYEDERYMKIHTLMLHRHEWPDDVQEKVFELIKDSIERERNMLETLILSAQEKNNIRKDIHASEVSMIISSVFHGLFILQISQILPADFAAHTDFIFDAFARELETEQF